MENSNETPIPLQSHPCTEIHTQTLRSHRDDQACCTSAQMSLYGFFPNYISNPTPSLPPPRLKAFRDPVTQVPHFPTTLIQKRHPLPCTQQPASSMKPSEMPLTRTIRAFPFRAASYKPKCKDLHVPGGLGRVVLGSFFRSDVLQSSTAKLLSLMFPRSLGNRPAFLDPSGNNTLGPPCFLSIVPLDKMAPSLSP